MRGRSWVRVSALAMSAAALAVACSGREARDVDDDDGGSGGAGVTNGVTQGTTAGNGVTSSGSGGPVPGEPPALEGILAAHNDARAEKGLAPLQWDDDLAAIAAAWGAACVDDDAPMGLIDHNEGRSDSYPGYVGENIYGSSGASTGPAAVQAWVNEEADYDYANNSCSAVCGHYTQVVWADTTHVGCAISDCPALQFGWGVVCNYAPGGNVSGQRPY